MGLSADRFLAIHLHLRYQELVTHKRVVTVVILTWLFNAFLILFNLWIPKVIFFVVAFILCFCFISTTFFYCKIYLAVRRRRTQMQAAQIPHVAQNGETLADTARLRKFAVTSFYVYLVFLICYFPEYCNFVSKIISPEPSTTIKGLSVHTLTTVFLNSSLNPVVFCWRMRYTSTRHHRYTAPKNIIMLHLRKVALTVKVNQVSKLNKERYFNR